MRRFQESSLGKVLAALLLLVFTFSGTIFGLQALLAAPFIDTESYEQTNTFSQLIGLYQDKLVRVYSERQALETNHLTYAERWQAEDDLGKLLDSLKPENTNFRYRIYGPDGSELATNIREGEVLGEARYATFTPGEHAMNSVGDSFYDAEYGPDVSWSSTDVLVSIDNTYTAACGAVNEEHLLETHAEDEFAQLLNLYYIAKGNFSTWVALCGGLLAGAVLCLLYLLWTAGHKAGEDEVVLTWQERIFSEFYLLFMTVAGFSALCGAVSLGDYLISGYYHYGPGEWRDEAQWLIPSIAALTTLLAGAAALTLRTFVVRLKAGALARTTLICRMTGRCWQVCRDLVHSVPLFWKTAVAYVAFFFANVALFTEGMYNSFWMLLWLLLNLIVFLCLCWWTLSFHRLREGSRAIAAGDLNHRLDTARMPMDLKAHAEDLNNISSGLSSAVDEQMKSERFKAELITNVSHDLKTPLTSIISYVDLLKTTDQTDPKAQEYIQVLDRKSQRLKKLTEDLVEASKASTGVLTVNREKIGMAQLMDQALGEWTEKLEARKLTVVTTLPEGETWVYADGRHLWRVIDNLLSNCAKYAMEGTRVYLDLTRGKGQIILSVKNISREPLNVAPERLMERFVRGEESRTTEGSGLGLSIARSLTELQGGAFELAVDGDLFKATVSLPQAN